MWANPVWRCERVSLASYVCGRWVLFVAFIFSAQELELENASLANQLSYVRTAKEAEVNKLTKKLG